MRIRQRRTPLVAVLAAGVFVLAGCASSPTSASGTGSQPVEKVELLLNFPASGFHAGYAAAVEEGFYKEEGLDVKITPGTGSAITAQLIANGQFNIGVADATAVAKLAGQGAPLKNILTMYQSNANTVTVLAKSDINSVKDLKGHTVGTPTGGSQTAMIPILLKANGLKESDIKEVALPATSMAQALLQGQVDAILGSADSYNIQVEQQGEKTRSWLFSEYGVATVSTGVFGNSDYMTKHPDIVKRFVAGTIKGWALANQDPSKAIDDLLKYFPSIKEDKREQSTLELKAVDPIWCANGAQYVGKATADAWKSTQDELSQVGLLTPGIDPEKYYTHDYLPKPSEMQACENGKPQPLASLSKK